MHPPPPWIVLAHILRPQGRKGEVLADLYTDFPDRFSKHPRVWLAPTGFAEHRAADDPAATPADVTAHWLPMGKNAGRIVLHFAGVASIEDAERLAGKEVVIPTTQRLPLDAGATYISDLIGCAVSDRDTLLGVVEDVQFPSTPDGTRRLDNAAPLLEVRSDNGAEILIPYVKAYLLELNITARTIRMALPEGLSDLNQPNPTPSEST